MKITRDADGQRVVVYGPFVMYPQGGGYWTLSVHESLIHAWVPATLVRKYIRMQRRV